MRSARKTPPRSKATAAPSDDGFHWEEWRGGRLYRRGHHDGTVLSGADAVFSEEQLMQPIPMSALTKGFYKS